MSGRPPYLVGKEYESHLSFEDWQSLWRTVIALHYDLLKPGGFLVINIADILCFKDAGMPRNHPAMSGISRETVRRFLNKTASTPGAK